MRRECIWKHLRDRLALEIEIGARSESRKSTLC